MLSGGNESSIQASFLIYVLRQIGCAPNPISGKPNSDASHCSAEEPIRIDKNDFAIYRDIDLTDERKFQRKFPRAATNLRNFLLLAETFFGNGDHKITSVDSFMQWSGQERALTLYELKQKVADAALFAAGITQSNLDGRRAELLRRLSTKDITDYLLVPIDSLFGIEMMCANGTEVSLSPSNVAHLLRENKLIRE